MAIKLTESDAKLALRDHLVEKARTARAKHGFYIDADAVLKMLSDSTFVRYPTGIRFDESALVPGEFAAAVPLGDHPSKGFCIFIHPSLKDRKELLPYVIAYHIPPINYADMASPEDCECFGATLLGIAADDYYNTLCDIADSLSPSSESAV